MPSSTKINIPFCNLPNRFSYLMTSLVGPSRHFAGLQNFGRCGGYSRSRTRASTKVADLKNSRLATERAKLRIQLDKRMFSLNEVELSTPVVHAAMSRVSLMSIAARSVSRFRIERGTCRYALARGYGISAIMLLSG
jgi:hypothetical protein